MIIYGLPTSMKMQNRIRSFITFIKMFIISFIDSHGSFATFFHSTNTNGSIVKRAEGKIKP